MPEEEKVALNSSAEELWDDDLNNLLNPFEENSVIRMYYESY